MSGQQYLAWQKQLEKLLVAIIGINYYTNERNL